MKDSKEENDNKENDSKEDEAKTKSVHFGSDEMAQVQNINRHLPPQFWVPFVGHNNTTGDTRMQRELNRLWYGVEACVADPSEQSQLRATMSSVSASADSSGDESEFGRQSRFERKARNPQLYRMRFDLELDDCGISIFGRALYHYHLSTNDDIRQQLYKTDRVIDGATIQSCRELIEIRNNEEFSKNIDSPWAIFWPRPKHFVPLYLDLIYNPSFNALSNPNYAETEGLTMFIESIQHCFLLKQIRLRTLYDGEEAVFESQGNKETAVEVSRTQASSIDHVNLRFEDMKSVDSEFSEDAAPPNVSLKAPNYGSVGSDRNDVIKSKHSTMLLESVSKLCSSFGTLSNISFVNIPIDLKGMNNEHVYFFFSLWCWIAVAMVLL